MSQASHVPSFTCVFTKEDYDQLLIKAVRVIGVDRINAMSDRQLKLLNGSLDRILQGSGSVAAVTDLELIGAYVMIAENVLSSIHEAVGRNQSE
jgi:hypothetical protein